MNKGVGIALISKALGHTNTITTMNYLGKFDDNTSKEINEKLL